MLFDKLLVNFILSLEKSSKYSNNYFSFWVIFSIYILDFDIKMSFKSFQVICAFTTLLFFFFFFVLSQTKVLILIYTLNNFAI